MNSYVNKIPLRIVLWYKLFPILQKISYKWSLKEAVKLFTKPIKFKLPSKELELRNKAEISYHNFENKKLAILKWKAAENNPWVLLMHGWASRGTHFHPMVKSLLEQGYNVIAPDAPGHGLSPGKESDILKFAEAIKFAVKECKPEYWICHSMGGSAAMYAIREYGYKPKHLSILGTPSIAKDIIEVYFGKVNAPISMYQDFKDALESKYSINDFSDYTAEKLIQQVDKELSINLVYDEKDVDAPVSHGKCLLSHHPNATLEITAEYGHTNLIKSLEVLEMCQKHWR